MGEVLNRGIVAGSMPRSTTQGNRSFDSAQDDRRSATLSFRAEAKPKSKVLSAQLMTLPEWTVEPSARQLIGKEIISLSR